MTDPWQDVDASGPWFDLQCTTYEGEQIWSAAREPGGVQEAVWWGKEDEVVLGEMELEWQ